MKVVLNVVTNFEGTSLKPGDEIGVSQKVAERWINRGIAHYPIKEQKGEIVIDNFGIPSKITVDLKKPIKKSKRKRKKKANEKNQYSNSSKKRFGLP